MKPISWVGILLIVLGVLVLAYQGMNYTRQKKVLDVGSVHLTTETHERIPLPPIRWRAGIGWRGRLACHGGEEQVVAWAKDRASGVSPPGLERSEVYDRNPGSQAERRRSMLLLIIVLLLLFGGGGGYYGYSRWGTGGGLGIVGTVLLIGVVLYFLGVLR